MNKGWNIARAFDSLSVENTDKLILCLKKDYSEHNLFRFPGGTISFDYNVNKTGYGDSVNKFTENHIYRFIDFVKKMNGKVILVFDLYNDLLNKKIVSWDKNFKMLEIILTSGLTVDSIELGNELYMHDKITGYNSFIFKERKIKQNIELYLKFCELYKNNIPKNIQTGVPIESYNSKRGRLWNNYMETSVHDFLVPHFYSSTGDIKLIEKDLKSKIPTNTNKKIKITEYNWSFGSFGELNNEQKGTNEYNEFHKNFLIVCEKLKIDTIIKHSMFGTGIYNEYYF